VRGKAVLVLVAALAALGACNTPPREAHETTVAPATPAPPPVASASASVPAPPPPASSAPPASSGSCASDEDCRTFSSYCAEAPCACRVLSARDPAPKCLGGAASNVRCFADPCMNKVARCQSHACVLTAK
jgi:hypothetical protein